MKTTFTKFASFMSQLDALRKNHMPTGAGNDPAAWEFEIPDDMLKKMVGMVMPDPIASLNLSRSGSAEQIYEQVSAGAYRPGQPLREMSPEELAGFQQGRKYAEERAALSGANAGQK